ncbi:MAG: endonuclease III [Syntrophales bacterium]|jgi:endonuclease-3|nr:endonuclease III [Syntrophales bacterium]MDY0043873.1 endonuclease III [Syntrophales bacterium]
MLESDIDKIISTIKKAVEREEVPVIAELSEKRHDPFRILISTLLSLRTKDEVTKAADRRLFSLASNPFEMAELSDIQIREAIYPVGFYRNKAATILHVSRELIRRFEGKVPDSIEELLTIKGVGRKTANLVVSLGYDIPAICVDTHVHRVSNRLGYVKTGSPEKTEFVLREKLPSKYWIEFNSLIIAFGKSICRPLSPFCSTCPVYYYCDRIGVAVSR